MDLSKFTTKQLLAVLQRTRQAYFYEGKSERNAEIKRFDKGGVAIVLTPSYDELKEELSKREHIPNSKESKIKRKLLAYKYRKHVK